eukprot:gene3482-3719_t
MYSFATESVDDLYAPEVLNRAIKDWIEADDPEATPEGPIENVTRKDSFKPSHSLSIQDFTEKTSSAQTSPKSSIELTRTLTDKKFQLLRQSDELPPITNPTIGRPQHIYKKALSLDSSSTPSTVIHSTLSMKSHDFCCCCTLPNRGHVSFCCVCCVLCIPCYQSEVYLPSHTCQVLLCEGAGSYYHSMNFSDISVNAQYSLCFDLMCFVCCGHYYCCVWEWIADGSFSCQCWKCNNQLINIHRDIYQWTSETYQSCINPKR